MGLFGVQLTHFVVGVCEHIISLPPSQQHGFLHNPLLVFAQRQVCSSQLNTQN